MMGRSGWEYRAETMGVTCLAQGRGSRGNSHKGGLPLTMWTALASLRKV